MKEVPNKFIQMKETLSRLDIKLAQHVAENLAFGYRGQTFVHDPEFNQDDGKKCQPKKRPLKG